MFVFEFCGNYKFQEMLGSAMESAGNTENQLAIAYLNLCNFVDANTSS